MSLLMKPTVKLVKRLNQFCPRLVCWERYLYDELYPIRILESISKIEIWSANAENCKCLWENIKTQTSLCSNVITDEANGKVGETSKPILSKTGVLGKILV